MTRLTTSSGNDVVYTPRELARRVVRHFQPSGTVLEPCAGDGAFLDAIGALPRVNARWCEVAEGCDFFDYADPVDWIITNPPWSIFRAFARHAYSLAEHVVWLAPVTHVIGMRARVSDYRRAGFFLREIRYCDTPPPPWPASGFQLAALHLSRESGAVIVGDLP